MESMRRMLKERNAALFSLDRRRIEKYMAKYGDPIPKNISDTIFWGSVYKAICSIDNAPEELVTKARMWLLTHNMSGGIRTGA